jgi:hypothetical protein
MSGERRTEMIEVDRVLRVAGQSSALRLDLSFKDERCSATVRRSLDPGLFDFLAAHAEEATFDLKHTSV